MNFKQFTPENLKEFLPIYCKSAKSFKVYKCHFNAFVKFTKENSLENESMFFIFSKMPQNSSKSVLMSFVKSFNEYLENHCTQKQNVSDFDDASMMRPASILAEELRQKQELLKIQADELAKTQAEAKKQAQELEKKRFAEAKAKADQEAKAKAEAKATRLAKLTAGFKPENIPESIISFDIDGQIPQESKEYFQQDDEKTMFYNEAQKNKHCILKGLAGSGKTELVIKYCHENKIPLYKFSCSNDVKMSDLIGSRTFDEKGNLKVEAGMLLKALLTANKQGRAVLLLDEINTLSNKCQKNINGLTDSTGFIDIPKIGKMKKNKGTQFLVVGTMNANYNGTNPLNPEIKDRFSMVDMPKMSKSTKHKIYSQYGIDDDVEKILFKVSEKLEKMQQQNKVENDVVFSTRSQVGFLETLESLRDDQIPNAIRKSFKVNLVSKFNDPEESDLVQNMVDEVLN